MEEEVSGTDPSEKSGDGVHYFQIDEQERRGEIKHGKNPAS